MTSCIGHELEDVAYRRREDVNVNSRRRPQDVGPRRLVFASGTAPLPRPFECYASTRPTVFVNNQFLSYASI